MKAKAFTIFSLLLLFGSLHAEYKGTLKFKADNTFLIQQITDTHYNYDQTENDKSTAQVTELIKMEDADVIAMTGDMVSGDKWDGKTPNYYATYWKQWTEPINVTKKPYFYLLGNHDSQADLNRKQVMEMDITHPYSMSQVSPATMQGASTYVLPIYDPEEVEVVFYIWVFDSGSNDCEGVKGYNCIDKTQIDWYREKTAELEQKDGRRVPGIVFFHIPSPEWLDLNNNGWVKGYKTEDTACWSVNTGFYAVAKELGNVSAFICGHDHDNDFMGEYHGIYMIYGRKTGYGSYGPREYMPRGSRMFPLRYDPLTKTVTWDTYIRTLYGTKEEQDIMKWAPQLLCDRMETPGFNPSSPSRSVLTSS